MSLPTKKHLCRWTTTKGTPRAHSARPRQVAARWMCHPESSKKVMAWRSRATSTCGVRTRKLWCSYHVRARTGCESATPTTTCVWSPWEIDDIHIGETMGKAGILNSRLITETACRQNPVLRKVLKAVGTRFASWLNPQTGRMRVSSALATCRTPPHYRSWPGQTVRRPSISFVS